MMPSLRPAAVSLVLLLGLAACRDQPSSSPEAATPEPIVTASAKAVASAPATSASAKPRAALTRVAQSSTVCMVNDQYMEREQIPVPVEGRTYYGCCAGCKDKLQKNPSARNAVDPVSGKVVDKATAVIGRTDSGKVFYFESEETLARYATL